MKDLISVCVPAYNRKNELKQLIASFLNQDYPNKELVISDDSSNSDVKKMIKEINTKKIRYFKNKKNLGFAGNLYSSLIKARGKYCIILGDDDIFLSKKTLSKYVSIFQKNRTVHYVYSNQVQFSTSLDIECEINMFSESKFFHAQLNNFKKYWLSSIFIGGLAFRNDKKKIKKILP